MAKKHGHAVPKVGTVIQKKYKKKVYSMVIVKDGSQVTFEVNGRKYASPSAAAKSITKSEVNGWKFWNLI
jgi:hypothetical protein